MPQKDKKTFVPPRNSNDLTGVLSKAIEHHEVGVYIDAANLYHAAQIARLKISFTQMVTWLKAHCKLKVINFYTAYDPEDQKQVEFLSELEKYGYKVVKKPLRIIEQTKKGNMDIEIAVDAMKQQNLFDVMILISGDGDFGYLMQNLDENGKKTIVIGVGGFTSYELHQEVDNYFFFNRIREVWSTPKNQKESDNISVNLPEKITKQPKAKHAGEESLKKTLTLQKPKEKPPSDYIIHFH
jgi:uncharacterized LabA/DUF88 family protein